MKQGFTLVELLVVVAIIAILATIGISVFAGAQGSARDGKRMADINSIARSIETAKNFSTGAYSYSTDIFNNDFPKGVASQSYVYCINTNTTVSPPAVLTTFTGWSDLACPTDSTYSIIPTELTSKFSGTILSWTICARLERSSTPSCVTSLTVTPTPIPIPIP